MQGWADVIERNAASPRTARRLVGQLRACEAAAIAFCRLLERWGRGDAVPATAGSRAAALRHAADRIETGILLLELHQRLSHGCKARIYRDSDNRTCPEKLDRFEVEDLASYGLG